MIERLIDLFVADVCAGKQNETAQAYRTKLKMLARYLDDREITTKAINEFRIDMLTRDKRRSGRSTPGKGKLSVFTVRTVLITVRHFCKWMYANQYLDNDIASSIKVPKMPEPQPKAIKPDDMTALLSAAMDYGTDAQRARNVAILYWLRDTGGRVGGLLNATMENLDLVEGIVETREKGKTVQEFLSPETIHVLQVWLSQRSLEAAEGVDNIFISFQNPHGDKGQGMTRSGIYHLFRTLAREAGLEYSHMNPHAFRHAFARDFLRGGGELTQLAGILHHTSIWVTATYYTRWNVAELKKAHSLVNLVTAFQSQMEVTHGNR